MQRIPRVGEIWGSNQDYYDKLILDVDKEAVYWRFYDDYETTKRPPIYIDLFIDDYAFKRLPEKTSFNDLIDLYYQEKEG